MVKPGMNVVIGGARETNTSQESAMTHSASDNCPLLYALGLKVFVGVV
jgi:hypothetical protein